MDHLHRQTREVPSVPPTRNEAASFFRSYIIDSTMAHSSQSNGWKSPTGTTPQTVIFIVMGVSGESPFFELQS